jgi:hypothetical protein
MAKDLYLTMLITLLLRAILDDSLPGHIELGILLTFLLQSDKTEAINSSYFIDALDNWVPRLMKGIGNASLITIQHNKRRATKPATEPSSSL